jgi:hypothetical protein
LPASSVVAELARHASNMPWARRSSYFAQLQASQWSPRRTYTSIVFIYLFSIASTRTCAHTHGKGRQLCTALATCDAVGSFTVRGGGEAHGKANPLPCGLEGKCTAKSAARQTFEAHGKEVIAHDKAGSFGKAFTVRFSRDARQRWLCWPDRCRAFFAVHGRTVKALPSQFAPLPCDFAARQHAVLP